MGNIISRVPQITVLSYFYCQYLFFPTIIFLKYTTDMTFWQSHSWQEILWNSSLKSRKEHFLLSRKPKFHTNKNHPHTALLHAQQFWLSCGRRLRLALDPVYYLISKNGEFYSPSKVTGLPTVCVMTINNLYWFTRF